MTRFWAMRSWCWRHLVNNSHRYAVRTYRGGPHVGWKGDPHPRFRKFERWYSRPRKAHRLYWRLHK